MRTAVVPVLLVLGFACCVSCQSQKCDTLRGNNLNQHDNNINQHLEEALGRFTNCFRLHMINFVHTVPSNSCSSAMLQLEECDNDIVKTITDCKSPDKAYFPKAVFKVVSDYARYICSNAPKYKLPILTNYQTCFPTLEYGINCFGNFSFFNASDVVSKEQMCRDEKEVEECLRIYANETCPNDNAFVHILNDTFNFNGPPCKGGAVAVEAWSSALLSFALLILFADF